MRHLEEIKDMLCDELDKIAEQGELTAGSLDSVDKLTHSLKSIETIMAMDEYSHDGRYDRGYSYRRDARGRYSRDRMSDREYNRRYSRETKEEMIDKLEDMMEESTDHKVKSAIQKAISKIEE